MIEERRHFMACSRINARQSSRSGSGRDPLEEAVAQNDGRLQRAFARFVVPRF